MVWFGAALLAANLALLLPSASPGRVAGALLLIGLLPGLSWMSLLLANAPALFRWSVAAALSYTFASLVTLLLHYLPGPVQTWQLLILLNLLVILPLLLKGRAAGWKVGEKDSRLPAFHSSMLPILLILAASLALRVINLGYSEFQGDEALAMLAASEALTGHEDALWLRSKGPGEVLLPMALWRLAGVTNEGVARLPFTIAALWAILAIYLIGKQLAGPRLGWLAAGFFAFNGFMVAFGRIVQYQALVIWFSAVAWLLVAKWVSTRRRRFLFLAGLCLGTGLLAHYDAILVLPAIGWLLIGGAATRAAGNGQSTPGTGGKYRPSAFTRLGAIATLKAAFFFGVAMLLAALPFYLPFILNPQANRTGDYVGRRIGDELRNNLPSFFHFNTFYSSFYYPLLTGLLVLGLLGWYGWKGSGRRLWIAVVAVLGLLAAVIWPALPVFGGLDLSFLPFAVILLLAILAFPLEPGKIERSGLYRQALIGWLAVPFLGYNFVVALGLTHIYTIVPAWSILAGLGWHHLFTKSKDEGSLAINSDPISRPQAKLPTSLPSNLLPLLSPLLLSLLLLLSTLFLWNAFIRHDIEYWQDYPAGNLSLYWTPYSEPPPAGFFGFAHRTGWKAVGQKISAGDLTGDYGSNEEPDVTTWYTRGAPRACDPRPEFYYLADDLIDPVDVPDDLIASAYRQVGAATLPNQKQMRIMQQIPATLDLGEMPEAELARQFDQTATPDAFARSARGSAPVRANFNHLVRLVGYDLSTGRAYPGGRTPVTLYWQALAPMTASYHVFAHLEGAAGPVAQADGVPVCWTYPTDLWRPGQILADQHAIAIPPDTPPGDYPLQVGLYLPDTFERLDVLDEAGNPAGTSITLTVVTISE